MYKEIKYIESDKNQYIKNYRKLKKNKWRRKLGLIPLEGIILFKEAVNRNINIEYIILSHKFEEHEESEEIFRAIEKKKCSLLYG